MAIYVIMEASGKPAADGGRQAAYIRDGFSVLAFLVPAFWLLWHRLWIEALVALAATLCLGAFGGALGLGAAAGFGLSLLVSLYVGLEGPALRIAALRRRGWREWGIVRADGRDEAELRYLLDTAGEEPVSPGTIARPGTGQPWGPARPTGPAMGLLNYPGGR